GRRDVCASAATPVAQPALAREVVDDVSAEVHAGQLLGHVDAAGGIHVHLHQLVADDVQAGQVHAVADQLGCHQSGQAQRVLVGFGQLDLAAGADVAARIAAVVVAPEAGVAAVDLDRKSTRL